MRFGHLRFDEKVRSETNSIILGPPGFGKSKLMENKMRQDLAARQPFCLIDFHSPLFEDVKKWCVYSGYSDRRIIIVDPSQGCYCKGTSIFKKKDGLDVGVQTSGMVEAVLSVWSVGSPDAYPVIYKLLKILFTIVVQHDVSLDKAFIILADKANLAQAIEKLHDPLISALWGDLAKLSPSEWSKHVTPTINKLFRVVQSKAIQRFMCLNKEDYNLELTFEDTILVNLGTSGSLDADSAKVFAALLLNQFYHCAKLRKGKLGKQPPPYFLYVDEWPLLPSRDFFRIAAETRKFGLLLTLANQDLSQIRTVFGQGQAETLLTLFQAQFCFGGLNDTDATRLAREWGIPVEKLKALAQRECFAKLPRQQATKFKVEKMRTPFIMEKRLDKFERRIAEKTGALPVVQVDELLRKSYSEDKSKKDEWNDEDFAR